MSLDKIDAGDLDTVRIRSYPDGSRTRKPVTRWAVTALLRDGSRKVQDKMTEADAKKLHQALLKKLTSAKRSGGSPPSAAASAPPSTSKPESS